MTEVVGDILQPYQLILPIVDGTSLSGAGLVIISGTTLWLHNGTAWYESSST